MKGTQYKTKLSKCLFLALGIFIFSLVLGNHKANAATLSVTADYERNKPTNSLEVKLNIESSSEITMLKYAYARVAKGIYFTKYASNGTTITKNADGTYSFQVTQNGYVSVFALNKEGEEQLLVFKVTNIDCEKPTLDITSQQFGDTYYVTFNAEDDTPGLLKLQYVEGAYASANDPIWDKTDITYSGSALLKAGKYTFLLTDVAGNTHIEIRKFGDSEKKDEEFRAVWISYLEFKSSGYTKKAFQEHIETMFNEVAAMNMNAVVVHVRPFGDAMYPSDYFPWSRYVSGKQGKDPGFDPLEIMVTEAHKRGLEFHAWLNPYRVSSGTTDITTLSADNPARIYRTDKNKANDRNVLTYSGQLYYNPASKEVQELLVNGIREIVVNYDVDGIHFDDYFYPSLGKNYTTNFDATEYNTYKKQQIAANKPYLSIADWRRENVNTLVRNVYSAIKSVDKNVEFGISPGGFMDALKANDKYYVDFETWLGYDGYIDYLCPQLYWTNEHSIYPYNHILQRFLNANINPDVKMYVGIAAYKAGIKTEEAAWHKDANVLRNMITYARNTGEVDGFILFRYDYLISKRNYTTMKNMMKEFK